MIGRAIRCAAASALLLLASGCSGGAPEPLEQVLLRVRSERAWTLRDVRFEPAQLVRSVRRGQRGWLAIERRVSQRALRVQIPDMCPVSVPPGARSLDVRPLIDLGGDRAQLGFDAPFQIDVARGCAEAAGGRIRWRQLEGQALDEFTASADGFQLRGRTLPFGRAHPEPVPHGIVPLTARTQGRYVLEALFRATNGRELRGTIVLTASARASGVPSLAVSQQVLLGGQGWRVREAPGGGKAQVEPHGAYAHFTPDAPGRWQLVDGAGSPLTVQAFRHDLTPMDCGRSGCHAEIAQTSAASAMSHAYERRVDSATATPAAARACLLDCHVTGERGLHDGGFLDLARRFELGDAAGARWAELPQALRRLAGVRCTACHGPGAIPPAGARDTILRADVCAVCHDAPPAYNHVAQWRASRMARADHTESTRAAACAGCHTSAGFLAELGVRTRREGEGGEAAGISCAVCHAPHAAERGARLVRVVPPSADLGLRGLELAPGSALCVRCHAPRADTPTPAASSAVIVAGSARVPARAQGGEAWEVLRGPASHARVPGGCVGCHGSGQQGAHGAVTDHSFRADARVCTACHAQVPGESPDPQGRTLRAWSEQLWRELARRCPEPELGAAQPGPAHAYAAGACAAPGLTRARYEVLLVREDGAAFVHNARFARSLLEDAERALREEADHELRTSRR